MKTLATSTHKRVSEPLKSLAYKRIYKPLKYYCVSFQQKNNHSLFAININFDSGFFAQLSWCLDIFAYCEHLKLKPYIILSGTNYTNPDKGNNWLDYFFINAQLSNDDFNRIKSNKITISHIKHLSDIRMENYCKHINLSLAEASFLFQQNLTVRQEILKRVDAFANANFSGRHVLGVHYRGTDKISEADRVSRETCRNAINDYLHNHPEINCLFLSSDEASFIDFMGQEITSVPVCYHDDQQRSHDGRAIHSSFLGDNYIKGREALINCLLLSRCDVLIRTTSFLSAWSSIFNPELPVILLNKPYRDKLWFPESAIINGQRTV